MNEPLAPIGFWSYTSLDDRAAGGKLTALRQLLADDLQSQLGRTPVRLFQDKTTIPVGRDWEAEIRKALSEANFFIPVITPGFLQSEWCCKEVRWFRERERALGRNDLIFPLFYVDVDDLQPNECCDPEVRAFLLSRKAADFRSLRLEEPNSREVLHRLAELAGWIRRALRLAAKPERHEPPPTQPNAQNADKGTETVSRRTTWTRYGFMTLLAVMTVTIVGSLWVGQNRTNIVQIPPAQPAQPSAPAPTAAVPRPAQPVVQRPAPDRATVDRDCLNCPEMILIPPGSYLMGIPESEDVQQGVDKIFDSDARPVTRIDIARSFWIGRFPVTVGEYSQFVRETNYTAGGDDWKNPRTPQDNEHPVVNVSAEDAEAYVAWLSRKTGRTYLLPSESMWEYAARAGTTTARYWGDGFEDAQRYAWVRAFGTAPVGGGRKPNNFGLYDMLGNVWQWTADCWHPTYDGRPRDGSVWPGGDCSRRVIRGAYWNDYPRNVRSGVRNSSDRDSRTDFVGFRVAKVSPQ